VKLGVYYSSPVMESWTWSLNAPLMRNVIVDAPWTLAWSCGCESASIELQVYLGGPERETPDA
jgi:hypothetical protein